MRSKGLHPDEGTTCEELAELEGGVVVDQCPPPGVAVVSGLCAALGDRCTAAELRAGGHTGCCDGGVCALDESGVATCRSASDSERVLAIACEHNARIGSAPLSELELLTTSLQTSVGTVEVSGQEVSAIAGIAGAGCLASFELSFGVEGCEISLRADRFDGKLRVGGISGTLTDCPGFEGDRDDPLSGKIYDFSDPPVSLTFDGFNCGSSGALLNDCVAGELDLHFDGELVSTKFVDDENDPPPTIMIVDQHLRFAGTACALYEYPDLACSP